MVGTTLSFDEVLDLCRDEHRRILLAVLSEREQVSIEQLTADIVQHNHHATVAEISDDMESRIRTSLHHKHLPRLADAGLLEYDRDAKRVQRTDEFDRVQPHLASILDADPVLGTPLSA